MHIMEVSLVYTGLGVASLFFTIMTELYQLTLGPSLLYFKYLIVLAEQLNNVQGSVSGAGVTFVTRNGTE